MVRTATLATVLTIIVGLNCDKINKPEVIKKTIFSLHTGPRDSTSLMNVTFSSYDTLGAMPLITINSTNPDTVESKEGFYRATFRKVHSDSILRYKFDLYNESIVGQLKVPCEIDSLFCNNHYIYGNYTDSTNFIDTASTYKFTWKPKQNGDYFSVQYWGDLNIDRDGHKFYGTKDTFLIITPEIKGLTHSFLKMKLENCGGYSNISLPAMTSNKIDIYYDIWPTRYTCEIYMSAGKLKLKATD